MVFAAKKKIDTNLKRETNLSFEIYGRQKSAANLTRQKKAFAADRGPHKCWAQFLKFEFCSEAWPPIRH